MRTESPHRRRIRATVAPSWRLRAYAAALVLVFASVPLLHLYMDVALSPVELAIHALDISLGALSALALLELGVSAWQRRLAWRVDATPLALAIGVAIFVVGATLLQRAARDVLPATAEIRAKHEAAGYSDMSVRALPFVALLGYLAFARLRSRWLTEQVAALRTRNDELARALGAVPDGVLLVRNGVADERLPFRSIVRVAAEENYCRIHVAADGESPARSLLVRTTLAQVLADLPDEAFVQVHRSHVVGLAHVSAGERRGRGLALRMAGGGAVPVSRARAADVRARLLAGRADPDRDRDAGRRVVVVGAVLCALVASAGAARVAAAHPLAPALLELHELDPGRFDVRWKTSRYSASEAAAAALRPVLPPRCRDVGASDAEWTDGAIVERWRVACGSGGLVGARVGVAGLDENGIDALLRVELADGRRIRRVLTGASPLVAVPAREGRVDVAASYAWMGVRHILGGPDHLLFVLGLVLLVVGFRPLLWTLTAFTVGHSVTLSLAALGVVAVPTRPIELTIAASVLWLAVELARPVRLAGRTNATPVALAAAFGLLHGLGFAGALSEAGLPVGEIPTALLSFNVGIEIGQIAFVGGILAVRRALAVGAVAVPRLGRTAAVYAMGTLAATWCIERAVALAR